MSFSSEVKNELSHNIEEKKCCRSAELAGFLRVSGSLTIAGKGKLGVTLTTENPAVARHIKTLLKKQFSIDANLLIGEGGFNNNRKQYEIAIKPERDADRLLRDAGILVQEAGSDYIANGIAEKFFRKKCCRKRYLKGLFLGAGTVSDPEKGYHLEIVSDSERLANDVKKLFNSFVDIHSKVGERKDKYVIYIKDSEQIKDILNIIGAHNKLLEFENVRIFKEVRNRTNRISNCDNANLDKTLNAADNQLKAIEKIKEKKGLYTLPDELLSVALNRLKYPEASLKDLGEMLNPPLKKSGIYHRMKKIQDIASKLE